MLKRSSLLLLSLTVLGCSGMVRQGEISSEAAIGRELDAMLAAWNADNLEAHIAPYAEDATWTTANGLLRGKDAIMTTLTNSFLREGKLVGDLTFGPTAYRPLGPDHMMTNGSFRLTNLPSGREITGQSTLIWRRNGSRWMILHDHSS